MHRPLPRLLLKPSSGCARLRNRDDISADLQPAFDGALRRLRAMRDGPASVAEKVDWPGRAIGDGEAADMLCDVAAGLRASDGVLRHGAGAASARPRAEAA